MLKPDNFYFLLILFITVTLLSVPPASVQAAPDNREMVLQAMQALRDNYKLPSLSLAVAVGDEIVFAEAIGYKELKSRRKASAATQYSIGSIAKPMTAIALARLVDLGRVDLDAPASDYVDTPAFTRQFTVRQLASHTAGVPHDTAEREVAEFASIQDHESPFDAFPVFSSHPLLFEPGTGFAYSSNGYILLSAIIERAAEMNYVDFLDSSVWSGLGMISTELDTSFAGKQHEATYYAAMSADNDHVQSESHRDRSFLFGGGGFISTPSDLVRLAQAIYRADFLSDKLNQEMHTPTRLTNGEENPERYSLGWRVGQIQFGNDEEQKWAVLHHGGVTDNAATSFLLVVPECKASIAFATNYVPEKFWQMRPKMAEILKIYINPQACRNSQGTAE